MWFKPAAALALAAALVPAAAQAADPPTPSPTMPAMPAGYPFATPQPLNAHVWAVNGSLKSEVAQTQAQVAKTNIQSLGSGSMASTLVKNAALSVLTFAAGPIGMIAGGMFHMFGHHSVAQPTFHAVLALGGTQSQTVVPSAVREFDCSYADVAGVDPDAFQCELVHLNVSKDNWRVVAVSTSSDPSSMAQFMMPAGMAMPNVSQPGSHDRIALDEDRVTGASAQVLGRGQARISLAQPLAPGQYAIVLRPIGDAENDSLLRVLRTVWDFTVA
ncbi:MAG TPA: hypothetical protein VFA29_06615 [Candidatus Baltobacteraceae bacterium]|nr:hypothetical protein [Candidatus Baltobacteraceae bacterium]